MASFKDYQQTQDTETKSGSPYLGSADDPYPPGKQTWIGQPDPFKATGKGLQNARPNFPATEQTGNAVLTTPSTQGGKKLWLYVDDVQTGWRLAGDKTQTPHATTFYPHFMAQDDLTISCQCANQYEADRIVEFVLNHQQASIYANHDSDLNQHGLDFKLFPHTIPAYRKPLKPGQKRRVLKPGLNYAIVISNVAAGHEHFQHFPTVSLTCKVVNDYLQKRVEIEDAIYQNLVSKYMKVFGEFYTPSDPTDAGTFADQSATQNVSDSSWFLDNHPGTN